MQDVSGYGITGIGIFFGLVAGVIVQLVANQFLIRSQRKNAVSVFKTEAQLNLSAVDALIEQVEKLKQRISASQVSEAQLWISFEEFDFSATGPLNQTGHLHTMLGPEGLKDHLRVLRFFNNQRAMHFSEMLRNEHADGKSLSYLELLGDKIVDHKKYIENTVSLAS